MSKVSVNQKVHEVDAAPDTPLLWVLRDHLKLTGTKYGCGMALCGACMVHIDGEAVPSCVTTLSAAEGKQITTIEAIGATEEGKALQRAWIELDVPQCGYCQSGQIMNAAALLAKKPKPSDADIDATMVRNICRCGIYNHIRAGIHRAADLKGA